MASDNDRVNEKEKVFELLQQYDNVMLVTHAPGDRLDARPMNVAKVDENCDVWFLTRIDDKVHELVANPVAQVVAQHEDDSWLSLAGRVEVHNDRSLLDDLWKEPYRAWFPDGKDDPNLRILAFRAEHGEYWDQQGVNKVEYGLKTAKAYLTGDTPDLSRGIHGETDL